MACALRLFPIFLTQGYSMLLKGFRRAKNLTRYKRLPETPA